MIPRLTFLLLLLVGLAFGPVRSVAACGTKPDAGSCHACCADPATACCPVSSAPQMPPTQTGSAADAGKQLFAPALTCIGFRPAPVLERPAARKRQAARMPVVPRLDLICVRLI